MEKFKFYSEPFDASMPPPSPPNREFVMFPIVGKVYTRESRTKSDEYLFRLNEYSKNLKFREVEVSETSVTLRERLADRLKDLLSEDHANYALPMSQDEAQKLLTIIETR